MVAIEKSVKLVEASPDWMKPFGRAQMPLAEQRSTVAHGPQMVGKRDLVEGQPSVWMQVPSADVEFVTEALRIATCQETSA
jgi:hypothetical protein